MAQTAHFSKKTFDFLRKLKKNNDRARFKANKDTYEADVKVPMLRFIEDFAGPLSKISRKFDADPSPVGGSLFRIYRDTRFGKDKTPYKTHLVDALKRPPQGFDAEHAFVEDLKRKDFIGMAKMTEADACKPDFLSQFAKRCKTSGPFVEFVCDALDVPF